MSSVRCLPLCRGLNQLWRPSLALTYNELTVASHRDIHTQPTYMPAMQLHLSKYARGVKVWETISQTKTTEKFDYDVVCEGVINNLKVNRYTRASTLTKIFDHVTTVDQLNTAERVLISFRYSLSRPTLALPLVIVRACLRVGLPWRALRYIKNKVKYGVFPTRRVYHVLLDAFIRENDGNGGVAVYNQMLEDEVIPDGMTFHLASRAYIMLSTPEGNEMAESLCRKCYELEPKLATKSFIIAIKTMCEQGHSDTALSLLTRLEADQLLLPQTQLNLLTHVLITIGELDRIMDVLKNKLCTPNKGDDHQLGLPQESWQQLETAVHESGDDNLIQSLENLTKQLETVKTTEE